MKIAVTYENGQVFQHFGHTQQFKLYEVENGELVSSRVVDTNGSGHGALAGFLRECGAEVLICGGIGGGARIPAGRSPVRHSLPRGGTGRSRRRQSPASAPPPAPGPAWCVPRHTPPALWNVPLPSVRRIPPGCIPAGRSGGWPRIPPGPAPPRLPSPPPAGRSCCCGAGRRYVCIFWASACASLRFRRMPFIILCFRHMSITKILILLLPVSPLRPALRAYETSQQIH